MMRVGGERTALTGLEVHDVVAYFAAAKLRCSLICFSKEREVYAEGGVGLLRAGDGLENEIDGCALLDGRKLRGDVSKHAALRRDCVSLANGVDEIKQLARAGDVIGGGVDSDDGVARAEEQAIDDSSGDADWVVSGVIGLQPRRETARQANGGAKTCNDADLACDGDEVLHAHELRDCGCHLRYQPGRERC